MSLPKKHLKSAKGQILILFLLVLVVGVAIVLSVASRTITNTRTTTTSDESNRAYYAAEAGIEEALQELQQPGGSIPATGLNLSFPTVNTTANTVTVTPSTLPTIFVYPENVARDDVAQVSLIYDFDNLTNNIPTIPPTTFTPPSVLNFYWGSDPYNSVNPELNPAIEVTVLYCVGSCSGTGSTFGLVKFAFDPYISRGNNFCTGVVQLATPSTRELQDSISGVKKTFYFKRTINIVQGETIATTGGGCRGGSPPDVEGIGSGNTPVLARIRLLYNPSSVSEPVAVTVGSGSLPAQGTTLESTGTTTSGVARKLQVVRLYPTLPALFDYVLFNGGCKTPNAVNPLQCDVYYDLSR